MSFSFSGFRKSGTKDGLKFVKIKRVLSDFPDNIQDHILKYYKTHCDSIEEFIKFLAPKFDLTKFTTKHQQIPIKLHGVLFQIDTEIAEIFRIVNEKSIVTRMSCQYNLQGYATFLFTSIGYQKFILRLQQAALYKVISENKAAFPSDVFELLTITDDDDPRFNEASYTREQVHDLIREVPAIRRFTTDRQGPMTLAPLNYLVMNSGLFRNELYFSNWVNWLFLPEHIPKIVYELQDVFSFEAIKEIDELTET